MSPSSSTSPTAADTATSADNRATATGPRHRASHATPTAKQGSGPRFVHTVIDDHSRVAYAEIHTYETAATAIAVLRRAVARFADLGVTVERVLSDNGSAYRSHTW
ncbi:integrase-like protein [Actinokineospora auranticolor]|uniref:Integrase-like protein n=1 Tax=Actinokineospora auranticolor TaxID=155976 RepID=A0A2S6GDJ3_9PSEU|nr:integrase-like protein [Actinokineospora auranticolor]